MTLEERRSGIPLLAKLSNKSADLVRRAIAAKLKPLTAWVETSTLDNGKEFADHYRSWQRGSNENFNGLLRQYIPKKRRMETVTDD